MKSFMMTKDFIAPPPSVYLIFFLSLNNVANKYSDKVVFGVDLWIDIIKSYFHLAVLQENHPCQMNKEIT